METKTKVCEMGESSRKSVTAIDSIGDDLLRNILNRLPALHFASASCVNHSWHRVCDSVLSIPKLASALSLNPSIQVDTYTISVYIHLHLRLFENFIHLSSIKIRYVGYFSEIIHLSSTRVIHMSIRLYYVSLYRELYVYFSMTISYQLHLRFTRVFYLFIEIIHLSSLKMYCFCCVIEVIHLSEYMSNSYIYRTVLFISV